MRPHVVMRPHVTSTFVNSEKSQLSQVSALFPDLVRSDTQKDAHQQTRLQTVFTQCSHSGAAWLLLFFFFFGCVE